MTNIEGEGMETNAFYAQPERIIRKDMGLPFWIAIMFSLEVALALGFLLGVWWVRRGCM